MQKKMCVYNIYPDGFLDLGLEKGNDDNVQNSLYACPTIEHLGVRVYVMGLQIAQWTMVLVYVLGLDGKLIIKGGEN